MKIFSALLVAAIWAVLILGVLRFVQRNTRPAQVSPALARYRALLEELRVARAQLDLPEEDRLEDSLLALWEELTPAERARTETFVAEIFK